MSALPRPDVTGPTRTLNDALHDLHHRAGWPSLRALARKTGVSHTTVSKVFSAPALPSWGTLELLVEALQGDTHHFHDLWLAASSPTEGDAPVPRIVGRRAELDVVRHHLEAGAGLLIVTGEAGIGKTALVRSAAEQADVLVAAGSCLPLLTEVPLLPVADAVRALREAAGGTMFEQALAECPHYVRPSISRILPEVDLLPGVQDPEDEWSRQRLFTAVREVLRALHARVPLALVVEDLHWADTSTLDLLEHLLVRDAGVPVVATWRIDDPDIPDTHEQWRSRIGRSNRVAALQLGPLDEAETSSLVQEVLGTHVQQSFLEEIHRRSRGHPLFAEQLASQGPGHPLPRLLADLLDRRLERLGPAASSVVSALGLADRAVEGDVLAAVTALGDGELADGLRELAARQLLALAPAADRVQLRHPLLAEAARRRLVGIEARAVHRQLALALGCRADHSPAEVAAHWEAAGDEDQELDWRIRAARAADTRFAGAQAALHWQRVLDLWPAGENTRGSPPISRPQVYVNTMDAWDLAGESTKGLRLAERALEESAGWSLAERAEAMRKIAAYKSPAGEVEGDRLGAEAVALYRRCPRTPEVVDRLVTALIHQAFTRSFRGQMRDAVQMLEEAQSLLAEQHPVPSRMREVRSMLAWHAAVDGRIDHALQELASLASAVPDHPEPVRDVMVGLTHTDVLLMAARPPEEVESAAQRGLAAMRSYGLDTYESSTLLGNVVIAWIRAGRTARAAELIDELTDSEPILDRWLLHMQRALLDQARGRMSEARARADLTRRLDRVAVAFMAVDQATLHLWSDEPARALELLEEAVGSPDHVEILGETGRLLALAARAAADLAVAAQGDRTSELAGRVTALRSAVHADPFAPSAVPSDRYLGPFWHADLARLEGTESVDQWTGAAHAADRLHRPHDASYARWRAAQCALREGLGTVAAKLLQRAASDAREHVPLSRAIAGTAAR